MRATARKRACSTAQTPRPSSKRHTLTVLSHPPDTKLFTSGVPAPGMTSAPGGVGGAHETEVQPSMCAFSSLALSQAPGHPAPPPTGSLPRQLPRQPPLAPRKIHADGGALKRRVGYEEVGHGGGGGGQVPEAFNAMTAMAPSEAPAARIRPSS